MVAAIRKNRLACSRSIRRVVGNDLQTCRQSSCGSARWPASRNLAPSWCDMRTKARFGLSNCGQASHDLSTPPERTTVQTEAIRYSGATGTGGVTYIGKPHGNCPREFAAVKVRIVEGGQAPESSRYRKAVLPIRVYIADGSGKYLGSGLRVGLCPAKRRLNAGRTARTGLIARAAVLDGRTVAELGRRPNSARSAMRVGCRPLRRPVEARQARAFRTAAKVEVVSYQPSSTLTDPVLPSLRANRSNPLLSSGPLDCFVAEPVIGPAEGRTRWLLAMTSYDQ